MRASFLLVFLSFFLLSFSHSSSASGILLPGSSWLVGPASIIPTGGTSSKLPCIMVNQYNNGYTLRFSGGGTRIMAMAVDFKKPVFKAGQAYNMEMSVQGTNFKQEFVAKAYNRQTLLLNTQEYPELYHAIQKGNMLDLSLENNKIIFAMIGMRDGISRMESCYRGSAGKAIPASAFEDDTFLTPLPSSKVERKQEPLPRTLAEITEQARQPVSEKKVVQRDQETPVEKLAENKQGSHSWGSPFKGDTAEEAVSEVNSKPTQRTKEKLRQPEDILHNIEPSAGTDMERTSIMRWRAIKGANLREILDNWAGAANTRMLWTAGRDFSIQTSVIVQGNFEEAVSEVLEQYSDKKVRPVGRIYKDPAVGQKVLLIERDGG